jgi:hypothetical protein
MLFESLHEPPDEDDTLYEDRIILVRAGTDDEAHEKAVSIGKSSKEQFVSAAGNKVRWVFREVLDVKWVFDEAIEDGTEVYSSFLNQGELENLKRSLQPHKTRA